MRPPAASGANVTLEVTFTTTPDLRVAELGQHRLRHRHHAEGVGLEHLAHRGHRRGLEHELSKGDVVVVPAGTPHWFKEVRGTFLAYVVKTK